MRIEAYASAILLLVGTPLLAGSSRETTTETVQTCGAFLMLSPGAGAELCADRLLARAESVGDGPLEGTALYLQALAKAGPWRTQEAIRDLKSSAEVFTRENDSIAHSVVLLVLGTLERRAMRLPEAESHLREGLETLAADSTHREAALRLLSLAAGTVIPGPIEPGTSLPAVSGFFRSQLASVLTELEHLDEAEGELLAAQKLVANLGPAFEADIEEQLGLLRRRQGRIPEACEHYRRAIDASRRCSGPCFADDRVAVLAQIPLLDIDFFTGRLDEVRRRSDEILAAAKEGGSRRLLGKAVEGRVRIAFATADFAEAESLFKQALAIAEEFGDTVGVAQIENDLGGVYFQQGRHSEALVHFERSLALMAEEGYLSGQAQVELAIRFVNLKLGLTKNVVPDLKKNAQEAGNRPVEILADVAEVLASNGASGMTPEKVRSEMVELSAQLEGGGDWADIVKQVKSTAWWDGESVQTLWDRVSAALPSLPVLRPVFDFDRGFDPESAANDAAGIALLESALREFEARGNLDQVAVTRAGIAAIYMRSGLQDLAPEEMARAVDATEAAALELPAGEISSSYLGSFRAGLFDGYLRLLLDFERHQEAFLVTERARARVFLQRVGNGRLSGPAGSEQPALRDAAEGKRVLLALLQAELPRASAHQAREIDSRRAKVRDELQGLLVRLEATNPEYARLVAVKPSTLAEIQGALEPGTSLVSYVQVVNELHAWVVDGTRLVHVPLPVAEDDLAALADFAVAVTEPRGAVRIDPPGRSVAELSKRMYGLLIAPLREHLASEKLILVPHGPLHAVPFAALRNPETGRYLVEDFTLVYAPSASVLPHLRAKESPVEGRALVVGSPPRTEPGLEQLAGAANEAREIAKLLGPGASLHLEAQATEGRLAKLERPVDLIHVAAHSVLDTRAPQFSRLVLAPGGGFDGNLEVHELLGGIDWSGVNLVVLSACETARGERTRGDEIVGLTRAVIYAGSPGVISTLWPIDDGSAISLMTRFYHHLMAGETAAQALRAAQLETLAQEGTAKPFHWAAFTLHGDPRGRWGAIPTTPAVPLGQW